MMAQFEVKQKLDFITKGLNARALFSTNRYAYFVQTREYTPYYYAVSMYDKINDTYVLNCLNPDKGSEWLSYTEGSKQVNATTYFEAAINYDRVFGNHGVSGLLVYNMRNYLSGNAGSLLLSLPHRNMGVSGRFTYNYDSRYFLEGNFGYNGSERFAKNNRWGFFPSIGFGWILTNEPFWLNRTDGWKHAISKLKLKATYGLVGNDQIGKDEDRFFYQSDVNVNDSGRKYIWGQDFGYTVNGVSIKRYANESIGWEISKKMNVGIELGLFDKEIGRAHV